MKFIIVILMMISISCFGQYPRKANVVIIETDSLAASRLFYVCVDVLESEGFRVDELDRSSLVLVTDSVLIHKLPLLFKLEIRVMGTLASIRGYIRDGRDFKSMGWQDIPQEWEDAAYRSFSGSTWRTGFKKVVNVAERIRSETYGKVRWDRW
ncbi:MAG: hypothetical protein KFF73_01885 [Cyclobacteriaceae bacterium]|nr:hypothetical protein [Cyclobacteriaceae bacterium]